MSPGAGGNPRVLGALLVTVALGLAVAVMSMTFEDTWRRGWLGHNGARYAAIARNHARLGLTHLGGAPLLDGAAHDPAAPDVYGHHPPALGWTLGAVFMATGPREDVARGFSALATVVALILLASLVGRATGPPWGGVAALLAAAMPMVSIYGAHVDVQGPPVLALSLGTLIAYRRLRAGRGPGAFLLLSLLSSSFDWYGLYAPAGCVLHLFFTGRGRERGMAMGLGLWTLALFVGWLVWLVNLPTMSMERFGGGAAVRGIGSLLAHREVLGVAAEAWWREIHGLIPAFAVLLPLAVLALLPARAETTEATSAPIRDGAPASNGLGPVGVTALLLLAPLLHGALFPAGMLQHGYWLFALPYGLAAGLATGLARWLPPEGVWRLVPLAVISAVVVLGLRSVPVILDPAAVGELPAELGLLVKAHTEPHETLLTNYDTNAWAPEFAAGYVLKRPAFPYYADRTVRGGIVDPAQLAQARSRHPGPLQFLLTPAGDQWAGASAPVELRAALESLAADPPVVLSESPRVELFRLGP